MEEITVNSIKNTRISLARNAPVALVLGAASFVGSHLVDNLLKKGLQVIGVDDLSQNSRKNLTDASADKNFHLVVEDLEKLNLEIERLDYIFVLPQEGKNYKNIFDLFKKFRPRLLLFSSVELYENNLEEKLKWLKRLEIEVAKVAKDENLNARILRIGAIFGPRMDFTKPFGENDPITKLIYHSLKGDLQKETVLQFSSRAIFVDDLCFLAIKCILAGATAQKIFDAVLPNPYKTSDIQQILLNPIWYESRNFEPEVLPPWTTPNLEKTMRVLNWQPRAGLVESLKTTINYFKENDVSIDQKEEVKSEVKKVANWDQDREEQLKAFKGEKGGVEKPQTEKVESREVKKVKKSKSRFSTTVIYYLVVVALVGFALIWPVLQIGFGIFSFRYQLSSALKSLQAGEFDQSMQQIQSARSGVSSAQGVLQSLAPLKQVDFLKPSIEQGESLAGLANLSLDSAQNTVEGVQNLFLSLKTITGETSDSPQKYFEKASEDFALSDESLSKVVAISQSSDFKNNLPGVLKPAILNWSEKLNSYSNLVKKGRALSSLLPQVVALDGSREYLVLLQNNSELRPTGGFIGSFAKVSFEGGKLKTLDVNDVYAIDGQLQIHVEPPKEIKSDLGQNDFYMRDANFDPDFPTSARQIEWFFNKETGDRVSGVIALDISAMQDLLSTLGSLDLPDYNVKISSQNLFEQAISHAEVGFFPGSQNKKSFLTALTSALFNKLFFLPNQNWPGIVTSMGHSLEQKHMSIYLDDPKLFSYVTAQNWGGVMPRGSDKADQSDFLAPVEANLGADKANYYLDRSYNLETIIGKDGEISHRLRIAYTNRSPSETFPAGKYKNRMRIYLPFGTKLNRVLWGEQDITSQVESFSEYDRSGYSMLLELQPKEQKTLVLDYQPPLKLSFVGKIATYRLDVVKQAGTDKDPFEWRVTYPINVKVSSDSSSQISPQQYSIKTDLSTDKTFKLDLSQD